MSAREQVVISVTPSLDHENRLTLTAEGDTDTPLHDLYEAMSKFLAERQYELSRVANRSAVEARAFLQAEASYLDVPA